MTLMKTMPSIGIPLAIVGIAISLMTSVPYIFDRAFSDHTRLYPGIGR